MTADERLAAIKARAEVANTEIPSDGPAGVSEDLKAWLDSFDAKTALARTDVPALVAALEAVLELHQPDEFTECRNCHPGQGEAHPHPCPTVQVVNEALGAGQ